MPETVETDTSSSSTDLPIRELLKRDKQKSLEFSWAKIRELEKDEIWLDFVHPSWEFDKGEDFVQGYLDFRANRDGERFFEEQREGLEANLFECGLEILENGQLKSSNKRSVHRARAGFGDRPVTLIREEFVEGSLQGVVYLPVLSDSFLASFKCEPRWSPVFYSAEKLLSDMAPQEPF